MLRRRSTREAKDVLDRQARRHRKLLKNGEMFLAACDAYGADESHPPPIDSGWSRKPPTIDASDELLRAEAAARTRLATVQSALGIEAFTELPYSATGYLLTHTDRRMLIFDGTGKRYLLQSPMKGLWLQPIDHGDDTFTLVFSNGDERVAVATRRESVELSRAFIESFPDRRSQTRRIVIGPDIRPIDF